MARSGGSSKVEGGKQCLEIAARSGGGRKVMDVERRVWGGMKV